MAHNMLEQSPGTAVGPVDEGHPQRWWILIVLVSVVFMTQLDLFVVNVAVPAISKSFHGVGLSSISWVLNAYAIVFAALLVPSGRLADHFGRRRFLLIGVAIFTISSVLCAAAPSIGLLVAGRAIQAIGAALIVPTSLGLLLPAFPRDQHAKVVGIWAGVAAVAASSGPPVGGLLIGLSWRWIFLINLPIGVFVLVAGLSVLPEVKANPGAHLPDLVSVGAVLASITFLILAIVEGPDWGWGSPAVIGLFAIGAATTALTVQRTRTHPNALIEATLFKSRDFTAATIALFLFFVGFGAFLLISVLFLQDYWHYSAVQTGAAIAPGPATAALFALNSGRIAKRFGRTLPASVGCIFMGLSGTYFLIAAPAHPSYAAGFLPGMLLGGVSAGLAQAPLFTAASSLPADRATTGSAVLNMSRQVGSAVGVALLVTLLGTGHPDALGPFHHGWAVEIGAGLAAALVLIAFRVFQRPSTPTAPVGSRPPASLTGSTNQ